MHICWNIFNPFEYFCTWHHCYQQVINCVVKIVVNVTMQLWPGFILLIVFTAVEKQQLYFLGFLQVLVNFLYQVVHCLPQIYLTDISKIRKACHRAHILNSHLQLWWHFELLLTAYSWAVMGGLVHQCCAPLNWSYKLEPNPNNAVHYKQKAEFGTDKVFTVIFNLLLT